MDPPPTSVIELWYGDDDVFWHATDISSSQALDLFQQGCTLRCYNDDSPLEPPFGHSFQFLFKDGAFVVDVEGADLTLRKLSSAEKHQLYDSFHADFPEEDLAELERDLAKAEAICPYTLPLFNLRYYDALNRQAS